MADGPAIQASSLRALEAGATHGEDAGHGARLPRASDADTPIVLMGYYNPIHPYGAATFLADAAAAGVDGLIVVDLPPEEDEELCVPAKAAGLDFIRLATPTTDDARLPARAAQHRGLRLLRLGRRHHRHAARPPRPTSPQAVTRLKRHTDLPVAVGFGIRTPSRRPPSPRSPTAWWWARPWSIGSPAISMRGRPRRSRPAQRCSSLVRELAAERARREEHRHELAHQFRPPEAAGAGAQAPRSPDNLWDKCGHAAR